MIQEYFSWLSEKQIENINEYVEELTNWNQKINLVSRKDIDQVLIHHIVHSLLITKYITFQSNTKIIDVGCGGGLPSIPLAICFPEVQFTLIDSTQKKIIAISEMIGKLKLNNVDCLWKRVEFHQGKYDFVLGRAVATLPQFYQWTKHLVHCKSKHELKNGVLYLKGGDISIELDLLTIPYKVYQLKEKIDNPYFETKLLVYLNYCNHK